MLINLLHHLYRTKVQCSGISSDGYSPQNLTSENWRERNQGFLAAHFIKPPVDILFQLPFPVNIESITIKPKVGSQITCGIDVLVAGIANADGNFKSRHLNNASKRKRGRNLDTNDTKGSGSKCAKIPRTDAKDESGERTNGKIPESEDKEDNLFHKYTTIITPASFKGDHFQLFALVSRLYELQGRNTIIVNKRFQERRPIQGPYSRTIGDNVCEKEFFHAHSLNYVTHVVVRITRVASCSVPAIGKMEIIGQVSAACSLDIVKLALEIQSKINDSVRNDKASFQVTKQPVNDSTTSSNRSQDINPELEIPEEFLDPITFTLMTIPVLLPSGLSVDTTTLDKHIEAEQHWGRLPSDPFTGKIFTDSYKPVPNGALKVRVDKFILTSGVDVTGRGRTTGRADSHHKNTHRESSKAGIPFRPMMYDLSEKGKELGSMGQTGPSSQDSASSTCDLNRKGISHEEHLSLSLDTALKETLTGLSFTRAVGQKGDKSYSTPKRTPKVSGNLQSKESTLICVACSSSVVSRPAFQLPCKHLVCRACLTGTKTPLNICTLCRMPFAHKDVVRVHLADL